MHWPRPQREHLQKLCQSLVHGHEAISTAAAVVLGMTWQAAVLGDGIGRGCNFKMEDLSNGPALMCSSFFALSWGPWTNSNEMTPTTCTVVHDRKGQLRRAFRAAVADWPEWPSGWGIGGV